MDADIPGLLPDDPPTARTCPVDAASGRFHSEYAENAYQRLLQVGGNATRGQFRRALIMLHYCEDKGNYEFALSQEK